MVAVVLVAGCGGAKSDNGFPTPDGGSSSGSGGSSGGGSGSGSGGGTFTDAGSGSGGGDGGNGCSGQATDFVYVLSAENDLYSFAPNLKQFTKIGPLSCQTTMQPNSMAVDRNAVAYVNYFDETGNGGAIYQVSTSDASCGGKIMDMPQGWYQVGMGYSTSSVGSSAELLYVDGIGDGTGGGSGLGVVDLVGKTVGPIGPFSGSLQGQAAELTGTGSGTLFGFFTTDPPEVAQIDKTNGSTQTPATMTGVKTPLDWAFSFWGGHFYLYTSQNDAACSDVTDYDPTSGTVNTTYMTSIGFNIVGAGVSTCAPVTAPQ
jgi:hypothetical protein